MASKVLRAQITVDEFQTSVMDTHQLEDYVKRNLCAQMTGAIISEMAITKIGNPHVGTNTYTGSLTIGANTISGFNGTTASVIERAEELRVVEFTKNGKVTRVELQRKTEHGWKKIPRIQIEE